MTGERVRVSIEAGVAEVLLARPDKRNALDEAMFHAIVDAGDRIAASAGVRAVVLAGEGPSFCAGLDLSTLAMLSGSTDALTPGHVDAIAAATLLEGRITNLAQQACWVWQELPVPVIAALQGHAIGGGIQLALGADIRIVHPDTRLSVREVHWGFVPDMTGTFRLPRLVRPDVAMELVVTGRMLDGREAHALGLATRLSEQPLDDARALAAEIAGRSPDAVRASTALLRASATATAADQFAAERAAIASLVGRPNQVEAVHAGLEQRPPRFADP